MPPELNEEVVEPVVEDRRDTIEKAFEATETTAESATTEHHVESETPVAEPVTEKVESSESEPVVTPEAQQFAIDKAPQSWRPAQKVKWDKLDSDIRQEVMRRERETTKVLGETAQARQFATQFAQVVQPFTARLQALGTHPITAVQNLLQADYILATAPKAQRAAFVAKLIKDYDVDISELDNALVGQPSTDPVASHVEELLQQRLAPFQQYMARQQELEQQQQAQTTQQIGQTIEQMANNSKYPYFEMLREDMADLIDIASKRGQYYSLEEAYSRASVMNPEVSKLVATQQQSTARASSAQAANARAQRALAASVSVGGAPSSIPSGTPAGTDRRAAIEAAFDSLEGR